MGNSKKTCKVCGLFYPNFYPWGKNDDSPSHAICSCCGTEFGYEDNNLASAHNARKKWLEKDGAWFNSEEKPKKWLMDQQIKNILVEWR